MALRSHRAAVLVAPPGAGKTTRVPLALLHEPWLEGRRILMLEPRRLAARAAARYMARSLGEGVGETVGYRMRLDTRVGPRTRIEVITEGILTRLLQADPALEEAGLIVFDEFHERSLHADLGLALCLQSQALLRPDLRILVMSATLAAEPVAALLGDAPILQSEGRSFPVQTHYLWERPAGAAPAPHAGCSDRPPAGRAFAIQGQPPAGPPAGQLLAGPRGAGPGGAAAAVADRVVRTIQHALQHESGDILVFLPGAGEIRRVESRLQELGLGPQVQVAPLYGNLPQEAQDRAIAPSPPGERKVVLATAIAETSLTVEGVRVVVDSGLMRVPRFSPRTGMTRLETLPVSRDAADQRRGRAGRLGPGVCYRLWTEAEDRHLLPHRRPEILEADLAPLALELAVWGVSDPGELPWLDPPPAAAFAQARDLLRQLGALGESGAITPHGRRMAELGMHPRLAHMVLRAEALGLGGLACDLAALLSERDIFRGGGGDGGSGAREARDPPATTGGLPDADLRLRVEALARARSLGRGRGEERARPYEGAGVDPAALRRVLAQAAQWRRELGIARTADGDPAACGLLLSFAYPDRIAQRRGPERFRLRSGRGAAFARPDPLAAAPYLVAAELDDQGPESRIFLAAPVELQELEEHHGEQIEEETRVAWDRTAQAVRARRRRRLGALVLKDAPLPDPDPEAMQAALLQGIREEGLEVLPWTRAARQLQQRLLFLHRLEPGGWPDAADPALLASLESWLGPHLYGLRSRDDLQQLPLRQLLEGLLTWEQRQQLEEWAPTHLVVPSGSRIAIDYSDPESPVLAVRIQELFGLTETPRIAQGRVPLTLHLLSPAHRPVQVTRDLAGFWQSTYFEVRKELRGRYPKHPWPDDPLQATPTNRTKRR